MLFVGSPAQIDSLPWNNINRLYVTFSEDVGASIGLSDFTVTGQPGFRANATRPNTPTITSVKMMGPKTVELTLSEPLGPMFLVLKIKAAGVTDKNGNILDGNWTNSGTNTRSGDGSVTDDPSQNDLVFTLVAIVADSHPTQNYVVNSTDSAFVTGKVGQSIATGGKSSTAGYDPKADINGDQKIDSLDVAAVAASQNSFLILN